MYCMITSMCHCGKDGTMENVGRSCLPEVQREGGMNSQSTEGFQSNKTLLYTIMVAISYTFVATQKVCNTKSEP